MPIRSIPLFVPCERCGGIYPQTMRSRKYCDACRVVKKHEWSTQAAKQWRQRHAQPREIVCQRCSNVCLRTGGGQKYCPPCSRDIRKEDARRLSASHRAKHPEAIRIGQQRYAAIHHKEKRYKAKLWRQQNPERSRASARAYAAKHQEERAQFRAEHLDESRARGRRWRQNNLAKDAARSRRRHARKRGAVGSHTYAEFVDLCESFSWQCQYCGERLTSATVTEDHIVPIVRGGDDTITNITIACRPCNSKKGTKLVEEFLLWQQQLGVYSTDTRERNTKE